MRKRAKGFEGRRTSLGIWLALLTCVFLGLFHSQDDGGPGGGSTVAGHEAAYHDRRHRQ